MRELCVAGFSNTELVRITQRSAECDLPWLIDKLSSAEPDKLLIASRNKSSSVYMDPELLDAHPEIGVIWMLRNPLDVLTSQHKKKAKGFYVEPYRLTASLNLYQQFRNHPRVLAVRYEDLVADPKSIQDQISDVFGLAIARAFTDCHEHFPQFRQNVEALGKVRPIDSRSTEKWRSKPSFAAYLADVLTVNKELPQLARISGGYEIDREQLLAAASAKSAGSPFKLLQSFIRRTAQVP